MSQKVPHVSQPTAQLYVHFLTGEPVKYFLQIFQTQTHMLDQLVMY